MKKFTLLSLLILFCCCFNLTAQEQVPTWSTNKNVILEEFTGRACMWCTHGHKIANDITKANPGRFWAINIHKASSLSPTTYPNLNTTVGATIANGFSGSSSLPSGSVNRSQGSTGNSAIGRGDWASETNSQLKMESVANVGGVCIIDPETRTATINVEIYYALDGPGTKNKLTIAMLQNNIHGSQSDTQNGNPEQWVTPGVYNHTHILRDIITEVWGDEITTISAGSLVQKTYTYSIPEIIGDPNGVNVVIEDLEFLAWVTTGTNYFTINCNELDVIILQGEPENIRPIVKSMGLVGGVYCGEIKPIYTEVFNRGIDEITSIEFEINNDGDISQLEWEGSMPSYTRAFVEIEAVFTSAEQSVSIAIVKINGENIEQTEETKIEGIITTDEWRDVEGYHDHFTLRLMQDKFGNQITWKVFASDLSIIAEGGPYEMLVSGSTKLHEEVIPITKNDCIRFTIYDSGCNGFNGMNGAGYYEFLDSEGNVFFESDAKFECDESVIMQVYLEPEIGIKDNDNSVIIYPNPANNQITISDITNIKTVNIYNITGKNVYHSNKVTQNINISNLNSGIYLMRLENDNGSVINAKFVKE